MASRLSSTTIYRSSLRDETINGYSFADKEKETAMKTSGLTGRCTLLQAIPLYTLAVFAGLSDLSFGLCTHTIHADEPIATLGPERPVSEIDAEVSKRQAVNPDPNAPDLAVSLRDRVEKPVRDARATTLDSNRSEGVIRFEFSGTYSVVIDGIAAARGEGTTTVELNRSIVDEILRDFEKTIRGSNLIGGDVIDGIRSLPSTIRSTNETLKMLSDPETQKALRQVESLLRLVPKSAGKEKLSTDSKSGQD
jgi:hypothetical protein